MQYNNFVLDPQVDSVIEITGRKSNVTVTFDTQKEDGEGEEQKDSTQKTCGGKNVDHRTCVYCLFKLLYERNRDRNHYLVVSDDLFCLAGKKKRKACSTTEDSPPKKTKLINDGIKTHNT